MTGLETAYDIIGIIFMGLSLLLLLVVITAIFVIRAKVVSLENMIKEKLDVVTSLTGRAADAVEFAKKFTKTKKH